MAGATDVWTTLFQAVDLGSVQAQVVTAGGAILAIALAIKAISLVRRVMKQA